MSFTRTKGKHNGIQFSHHCQAQGNRHYVSNLRAYGDANSEPIMATFQPRLDVTIKIAYIGDSFAPISSAYNIGYLTFLIEQDADADYEDGPTPQSVVDIAELIRAIKSIPMAHLIQHKSSRLSSILDMAVREAELPR